MATTWRDHATGIQHVGIPTDNILATLDFYRGLGFETVLQTVNEAANEKVAFLKLGNLVIETYENHRAVHAPGAIDHVAIDVDEIEAVFDLVKKGGYKLLDKEIQYLPFWKSGVKFFTIEGPNHEKLEFGKIL